MDAIRRHLANLEGETSLLEFGQQELRDTHVDLHERATVSECLERRERVRHVGRLGQCSAAGASDALDARGLTPGGHSLTS